MAQENKTLLTQAELYDLNAQLDMIAKNMDLHVNGSLTKAHGLNAYVVDYLDSAADIVGNIVLEFIFGTPPNFTKLYVPAQVTALGPAATDNGLVLTSTNPNGTSKSAGVPLHDASLITEFTADSLQQAEIYNELLLAHAGSVISDTGDDQCHGGTSFQIESVSDSLGHVVADRTVVVYIDGVQYRLLATTRPGGVKRVPYNITIAQSPSNAAFTFTSGYYQHNENRTGNVFFTDLYPSGVSFIVTAQGLAPLTYQWKYYALSSRQLGNSNPPDTNDTPNWINLPGVNTNLIIDKTHFNMSTSGSTFHITNTSTTGDFADLSTWFRCDVSDPDGTTISPLLRFRTHE